MNVLKHAAVLVFASLGIMSVAFGAEQRVLLTFDSSGHHVSKIVASDSTRKSALASSGLLSDPAALDTQELVAQLERGYATLVWSREHDGSYELTTEADPRISRAPAHIDGADASLYVEQTGAWLVSGPEGATHLTILLPEDTSLGLAFEQWDVVLTIEKEN